MDHFAIDLQRRRAEILAQQRLADLEVACHAEPLDRSQAQQFRDQMAATLERQEMLLRRIDDALDRMAAGDYGRCADCGEDIAAKRLAAIPWAERCLECQAQIEIVRTEAAT